MGVSKPPSVDEILESARLACESYFSGEFKSKRSIRQDLTNLRALLADYDARAETTTIRKAQP